VTVIGGFLPIPLAMMIPFMGAQSLVIGKQFGEGFQYGKRKISAMTNEEFNKLTPMELAKNSAKELSSMIPSMQASIADMRDFQSFIVKELIATIAQLPSDIFTGAKTAFEGDDPRFERPFSEAFQEDVTDPLLEWLKKTNSTNTTGLCRNTININTNNNRPTIHRSSRTRNINNITRHKKSSPCSLILRCKNTIRTKCNSKVIKSKLTNVIRSLQRTSKKKEK